MEAPGNCDNELAAELELMISLGNSEVEEKVREGNCENELGAKLELMIWLGNSEVEKKVPAILESAILDSELGGMLENSVLGRLL